MTVRVRFAPSPTGKLHVGSARTALFNWLFARHHKGTFILRIEDTDQKRSNPEFLKDIYASLEFLGIKADEGPIFQSQRMPIYQEHAKRLLAAGKAVEEEGGVVFKVPFQQVSFSDVLHGTITVDTSLFEDLVLMKSDGTPTYNFACVVDDADMRVSHVIRGDDHIANTPKQIVLYQALGYTPPAFVHIPLIVGADRSRLSKRHGATSVAEYREVGYLADAFFNYLALLGWAPGGNREHVPPEEIVQLFEIEKVRKTAAFFDQKKLDWLNGQYLKKLPDERLAQLIAERVQAKGWLSEGFNAEWMVQVARVLRERIKVLRDVETEHSFLFVDPPVYDPEAVAKFLEADGVSERLLAVRDRLKALASFDTASVEQAVRAFIAERQLETKDLVHPVRVAITGRAVSPPLFDSMSLLGKDRVLSRLERAATELAAKPR